MIVPDCCDVIMDWHLPEVFMLSERIASTSGGPVTASNFDFIKESAKPILNNFSSATLIWLVVATWRLNCYLFTEVRYLYTLPHNLAAFRSFVLSSWASLKRWSYWMQSSHCSLSFSLNFSLKLGEGTSSSLRLLMVLLTELKPCPSLKLTPLGRGRLIKCPLS